MAHLVYLHGFASGPEGHKARHLRDWAARQGITFEAPDLNLPCFEALTISAQVEAVEALLTRLAGPTVLVGASLGGLVAAAVASRGARLHHLLLLAPAFGFARRRLSGPRWRGYRRRGSIPVFHHAREAWTVLGPELLADLERWRQDDTWHLDLPITLLHGRHDTSVPVSESEAFCRRHPHAVLHVLEDDHALLARPSLLQLEGVLEALLPELRGDAGTGFSGSMR